jgi:hypothetical protein
MGSRLTELVLDCHNPELLAGFWCKILDYNVLDREGNDVEIGPEEGFGGQAPTIVFSRSDDPKQAKLRLHWDVSPTDHDQEAELKRLLDAGARHVEIGQSGEESWHVLADPEGNEFCLLRRRVAP